MNNSYQQFRTSMKNKNRLKRQKQARKEFLRQIDRKKKLAQSSDGSNQDQYIKKTYKKGNKWWNKINKYYFQNISEQDLQNMKQFTTSQDIIQFGSTVCPLMNYYQTIICKLDYTEQSIVFHDNSIRILFRLYNKLYQTEKHILVSYLYRQPLNNTKQITNNTNNNNNSNNNNIQPIQQIWRLPQFYSFHTTQNNQNQYNNKNSNISQKQLNQLISQVDIYLYIMQEDQNYIQKCLQYQTIWRNQNLTQIQRQIQCWEYQLQCQHKINIQNWDQIQLKLYKQKQMYGEINQQQLQCKIQQYKRLLVCNQTILYFRLGYSDKTPQQLQKAQSYAKQLQLQRQREKQRQKSIQNQINKSQNQLNGNEIQKQQQFFETDCKICFCTKNQLSNKVIYCDGCSTSFHQTCYGIQNIDKDKQILCDVCVYLKQQKGSKKQIPSCQICGRTKFPIKNIDNHFYHVSCLILFDFAYINQFNIILKQGITHQSIIQSVIQNQMNHDYCQFCIKYNTHGMQFKCSYLLCAKSFHPICAYLYGCIFQIERQKDGGMIVRVQCRDHSTPNIKDQISQVYYRRYLCNYKNTTKFKEQQFAKRYLQQLQKSNKQARFIEFSQGGIKKIFKLKVNLQNQCDKKSTVPSLKKSQSLIASNNSNSKSVSNKQTPKSKKSISYKEKQSSSKSQN